MSGSLNIVQIDMQYFVGKLTVIYVFTFTKMILTQCILQVQVKTIFQGRSYLKSQHKSVFSKN